MSDATNSPPTWFKVVAILAIVWNALGCAAYLAHVSITPEAIAAMPEAERALYESSPMWVDAAFAIAVWAGLAGSVLLALRRKQAPAVLVASLVGVLAQQGYNFGFSKVVEVYGMQAVVMPLMVLALGIALVFLARLADGQGWLR